ALAGLGLVGGGIAVRARVRGHNAEPQWPSEESAMSEAADTYRQELASWTDRGRRLGVGLTVGGAVLVAGGLALTTWSAVRMRRHRRDVALRPWFGGQQVGLSVQFRVGGGRL
ncbi:MAG: hypothetical protein KUG77_20475, partial [Nannocystaceae bacterium]|nr:hypothetical protein [Nannocystaceae bacterium]